MSCFVHTLLHVLCLQYHASESSSSYRARYSHFYYTYAAMGEQSRVKHTAACLNPLKYITSIISWGGGSYGIKTKRSGQFNQIGLSPKRPKCSKNWLIRHLQPYLKQIFWAFQFDTHIFSPKWIHMIICLSIQSRYQTNESARVRKSCF